MSKEQKKLSEYTDLELSQLLEAKFGRDLSHIAPVKTEPNGDRVFTCLDIGAESVVVVDSDGYVKSKLKGSRFADVLGTIF